MHRPHLPTTAASSPSNPVFIGDARAHDRASVTHKLDEKRAKMRDSGFCEAALRPYGRHSSANANDLSGSSQGGSMATQIEVDRSPDLSWERR